MKFVLTMALACGLAACATAMPQGGVANYDALQKAQAKCAASGGSLALEPGGNSRWLEDYSCKGK